MSAQRPKLPRLLKISVVGVAVAALTVLGLRPVFADAWPPHTSRLEVSSALDGRCMFTIGVQVQATGCDPSYSGQAWTIASAGGEFGSKQIYSYFWDRNGRPKCLRVDLPPGAVPDNGTPVTFGACDNSVAANWTTFYIDETGTLRNIQAPVTGVAGRFRMVFVHGFTSTGGMAALDMNPATGEVYLWDYWGGANQQWNLRIRTDLPIR